MAKNKDMFVHKKRSGAKRAKGRPPLARFAPQGILVDDPTWGEISLPSDDDRSAQVARRIMSGV